MKNFAMLLAVSVVATPTGLFAASMSNIAQTMLVENAPGINANHDNYTIGCYYYHPTTSYAFFDIISGPSSYVDLVNSIWAGFDETDTKVASQTYNNYEGAGAVYNNKSLMLIAPSQPEYDFYVFTMSEVRLNLMLQAPNASGGEWWGKTLPL